MKLLVLTSYLICPPISGGAMRMVNPILKLAETGRYEATYLFQYSSNQEAQRARAFFAPYPRVSLIGVQNRTRYSARERDLRLEMPLEVFNFMDLAYYRELERLLQTRQFGLVQVEHSWMSWVVPLIRKIAPELPVILDLHNIEATLFQRWIQHTEGSEREEMAVRWEKMRRWEEQTWQWYDTCLTVSPLDTQAYQTQTGQRIPAWELPSGGGIDLSRFPAIDPPPQREKETILSLGTMQWSANTHGLLWFIDEVLPLLKQTHHQARLRIAGFGTPDIKLMQHIRGHEYIEFFGQVEDERPLLSRSQVFIVPLWIGAGARVKILTAWAAGIPVVATTVGAEGLAYTDGENILIADDPAEFAKKVASLMENETLAYRLSHNGRALVEERYSLECAAREYDRIYSSVVNERGLSGTGRRVGHSFGEKERAIRQLLQLKADIPVMLGIGKHEDAISTVQRSLVWKMLAKHDRVVNKLLPQGTRRRGIYDLGLSGVRVIANEGWRSFFRKANLKVRAYFSTWKRNLRQKPSHTSHQHSCYVCGAPFQFPGPNNIGNLRETTLCHKCGATKRHQDMARTLLNIAGSGAQSLSDAVQDLKRFKIYLLESYGPIYDVLSKCDNFICSEFWDDVPAGTTKNGVRCEDVQKLTFPDESFDIVITQDVFEHVAEPEKGFNEIHRVLRAGGYHIFTVPFNRSLPKTVTRATIKDNSVDHILPPTYHGDRLRPEGALVFTDFGLDLIETLERIGFEIETFEYEHPEYAGGYNIVFTCRKKAAEESRQR